MLADFTTLFTIIFLVGGIVCITIFISMIGSNEPKKIMGAKPTKECIYLHKMKRQKNKVYCTDCKYCEKNINIPFGAFDCRRSGMYEYDNPIYGSGDYLLSEDIPCEYINKNNDCMMFENKLKGNTIC